MAVVKRGRKKQQSRPQKIPSRRGKLPLKPKRNVCIIRFPRSGYLTTCPLVSWYFNRRMRDDLLSLQKGKAPLSPCMADVHPKMSLRLDRQRKQQHPSRSCSAFLHAALKEMASKKRAKWVAASPQKRRRYSDEEIFYKLAKPSKLEGADDDSAALDTGTENMGPGISQPTASELQEALS